MNIKKIIMIMLTVVLLCMCISACNSSDSSAQTESNVESTPATEPEESTTSDTTASTSEQTPEPAPTPVDIETTGGVVIVGKIGMDNDGWYIESEQPLNVTYQYFEEKPSVFMDQTRIKMFDPKDDGIEKAAYVGQMVTVSGTFTFYRSDFETLYFLPYTIIIGKNAETSYSAPDLMPPQVANNLYDPTKPLPKYMDARIIDGKYDFNVFMLSQETIEFMGNDFADFYVGFVDAFLNYKNEINCPDKRYAEMLSTIIYDEFPLYNACAEPFEYYKDYDPDKGTVSIRYKYDEAKFKSIKEQFFANANELLKDVTPDQTDAEKAKAIYHALSTKVTYDYSALEEIERKESYYVYLNNSGVCVSFANVYNQLLTQVGIKTTLAYCDTDDGIGHAWSIITIDGQKYFCDPTYEISYDNGNGYKFFCLNYADRTKNGLGYMGIRYGRYYCGTLSADMIASESLTH